MRVSKAEATAGIVLSTTLLVAGCSNNSDPSASQSSTTNEQLADQLCAQGTYTLEDYKPKVGANLIASMGKVANGQHEYTGDTAATSQEVAANVAPNNASLALINTILSSESGITPAKTLQKTADTFEQIQKNVDARKEVCAAVIGRILGTPSMHDYQSPTGYSVVYGPAYVGNLLSGINGNVTTNTAPVQVFTIAPIAGSKDIARDQAISDSWGITANGQVLQTSNKNGEAKVSLTGETVHPEATASPSSNATGTAKSNSNNGGGVTKGNTPENNPGPNTQGPSGPHPEASNSASETTPAGGNTPTPKPSTEKPTPKPTPTPSHSTPTPTPSHSTPTPTPSHSTPTPTPTPKGSEPPCVPNPPYVIC